MPVAAGTVASVLIAVRAPTLDLSTRTPLWTATLGIGLITTGLLAVPLGLRWRTARARRQGAAEGARAAAADHHRFLLRLDHELKNPVTAIQAGMANLATAGSRPPDPAAVVDSIATQTSRLAQLVADLRKLAELETMPIERSPVELADLLAEVRESVPGADDRTVTVTVPQAPWPLGAVAGDRDLLFLALYNLLANAVKFTRPGETIEVRARDDGGQVVVEVADTGVGIPSDEVGQVWEELARGRAARGMPGMGLGLALVRTVVVRHGGTVAIRSREGHGTLATVRLPAAGPDPR